ncbi:hypothetical protein CKO25_04665 [Thiocapsa imhoffii]|uniref:DUF4174 domain-containing protein n=1 Tax=Thiocapsa imhoffii TaxID=382777 RepID=A0A9X0WG82_9GAMM|nr:hypothetical protein [Thiocapsa imhoffii]MBK1643961.1 hypothetical protein [Thiocapsa imhoffii]
MTRTTQAHARLPGWARTLITLAVLVIAVLILIGLLPRAPFSTDLSRIGEGTPALVIARDTNFLAGAQVMELIDPLRPDYDEQVIFLAAHLGHPDGQAFARQHELQDGVVIAFDGNGRVLERLPIPQSADDIRAVLERMSPR